MKANGAPEKIYVSNVPSELGEYKYITCDKNFPNAVKYTRTDAFIEKALKWYCLDCECNDNCKDSKCFFHNEYKRFLEGNKNACPPKFELTILNPDGSTSDNWRYRHFTRKMQDAFIEKADKFIISFFHPDDTELKKCILDEFHKYMKGE